MVMMEARIGVNGVDLPENFSLISYLGVPPISHQA